MDPLVVTLQPGDSNLLEYEGEEQEEHFDPLENNYHHDADEVEDMIVMPEVQLEILEEETDASDATNNARTYSESKDDPVALCVLCHQGFTTTDLYARHMSTEHHDERPFTCRHCGKGFQNISNCRRHESIHDPMRWQGEPEWQCDLCPRKYHVQQSLHSHKLRVHFGYNPPVKPRRYPVMQHRSTNGVRNYTLKYPQTRPLIEPIEEDGPFCCAICLKTFKLEETLEIHIKNVHENGTKPTNGVVRPRPPIRSRTGRPPGGWLPNQVHTCLDCGKEFKMGIQLDKHKTVHLNETPDPTGMKTFKCLICGKEDFIRFYQLRIHRLNVHKNIPFDANSDKEKPFACGVCGKPYYRRIKAVICAVLCHDPTTLRREMFKHVCPECPSDWLGYHTLESLGAHWMEAHPEKQMPWKLEPENPEEKQALPTCTVDKAKMEALMEVGAELEETIAASGEELPWTDLPLLPMSEEERRGFPDDYRGKKARNSMPGTRLGNYVVPRPKIQCLECGRRFLKMATLRKHEKKEHHRRLVPGRRVGRGRPPLPPEERKQPKPYVPMFRKYIPVFGEDGLIKCRFCPRKFSKPHAFRIHELRQHLKPWSTGRLNRKDNHQSNSKADDDEEWKPNVMEEEFEREHELEDENYWLDWERGASVNMMDQQAVRALLRHKTVTVQLERL